MSSELHAAKLEASIKTREAQDCRAEVEEMNNQMTSMAKELDSFKSIYTYIYIYIHIYVYVYVYIYIYIYMQVDSVRILLQVTQL